jgi:arginine:pyruvate transaminase
MSRSAYSQRVIQMADDPVSEAWTIQDRAVALSEAGEQVLFLTVGDPDFATPPMIVSRAIAALSSGRTRYSPVRGEPALRAAIARRQTRRGRGQTEPENVTVFPGGQNALFSVFQAIIDPGDEVIVADPCYATYPGALQAAGAALVRAQTSAVDGFTLTAEAIEATITPRTRAVLLNSPGNPTGSVLSPEALERIVGLGRAHSLWLICDEVYSDMVFDGPHTSLWSWADRYERIVVIDSVSKSLAMTGWRMGWAITPSALADRLALLSAVQLFGSCQFTQDTVAWALDQNLPEIGAMRQAYRERRDQVVAAVAAIDGLSCTAPAGGMFVLIDVSVIEPDGAVFARDLLEEERVAVVPGAGFGAAARGAIRISLTQPLDILAEAFERMAGFAQRRRSARVSR